MRLDENTSLAEGQKKLELRACINLKHMEHSNEPASLEELAFKIDNLSEQVSELTQLVGDVLNSLATLQNVNVLAQQFKGTERNQTFSNTKENKQDKTQYSLDDIDLGDLSKACWNDGHLPSTPDYYQMMYDASAFTPTGKHLPGWVRLSLVYHSDKKLAERIEQGCVCGGHIVLREANGEKFFTCENVRGNKCHYRPAVFADKSKLLFNVPLKNAQR